MDTTIDLISAETYEAGMPYDVFRQLRDEDPVHRHPHPDWGHIWVLTRHADVQRVSRDHATFSSRPTPFIRGDAETEAMTEAAELLVSLDPPDHTKLRKLINRGFTPRRVNDLTDRIGDVIDELMGAIAEAKQCDFVEKVATELPLQVIAELVGVPKEDRHQIFQWTAESFDGNNPTIPDASERASAAAMAMYAYSDQMCETRLADPRDDLMSVLLHAQVDGEALTQTQMNVFFLLLQNAGSETTRNLITLGTKALLDHPDQMQMLRDDLSLMPMAIEELLRYVTPVMSFKRTATVDTEIAGQPIPAGDRVLLMYAAANRDERVYDNPDQLDLTRNPTDHVAFGAGGPHFCLGASLARLEARMMFATILTRFEGLALVGEPQRLYSDLINGVSEMQVRWDAIRPAPTG